MTTTVTTPTMVSLALLAALLAAPAHALATDSVLAAFSSSKHLTVGPTVVAIAVIGAGLLVCVAGYWLIRAVFFACGFAVGAFATARAIEHFFDGYSWVELASWIGFVVGGVVFGLAVVSLYSLSVFIAGAAGGVVLAFAIHASIGYQVDVESGPTLLFLILVIALGIVVGVLSLVLQKPLLIITTSFVGAVAVAWGVGHFAGGFPTAAQFLHTARNDDDWAEEDGVASIPSAWWGYVAGIAVLSIAGMVVQFRKTRGYNYKHSRPTQFRRTAFLRPVPPPSQTARAQVAYMYATHPPTTERSAIHRV